MRRPVESLVLRCSVQEPKAGVTRQQQLNLKNNVEPEGEVGENNTRGRSRGRGCGRGRGRGRGKENEDGNKASKAKGKTNPSARSKRSSMEPKPQWQQDWEDWWESEHGPAWEHEGWDCNGKHWDGYAWASSKLDMYNLEEAAEEPAAKRKKDGGQAPSEHIPEAPAEKVKVERAAAKPECEEQTVQVAKTKKARKLDGKTESEKKKPKKVAEAPEIQEQAEKSIEMANTKQSKQNKRGKKLASKGELPHPLPKTREEQVDTLVDFGQRFAKLKVKNPFRQSVRKELLTFVTCRLNIYWTRRAVGVTDIRTGKDFAYFIFSGDQKVKYQLQTAVTVKTAELFAPRS